MSANTIPRGSSRTPLHAGEKLLTPGYTADLELRIPPTLEGPKRKLIATGLLWITSHRLVFITKKKPYEEDDQRQYDAPPDEHSLQSLIIPYEFIKDSTFNVPLFQTNNIVIAFIPDSKSRAPTNLPSPGRGSALEVKLVIGEGFGHNVWKRIEKERAVAEERRKNEEALPVYTPRAESVQGSSPPSSPVQAS